MATLTACPEADCPNAAADRCTGPTGAGCEELFCTDHLYFAGEDGDLCAADYSRIEVRA